MEDEIVARLVREAYNASAWLIAAHRLSAKERVHAADALLQVANSANEMLRYERFKRLIEGNR